MIAAAFCFGTMTAFVKMATQTMPPFEIVFFRSFLGGLLIAALMWKRRVSFIGKHPRLLAFRGLCGFLALSMHFYAISQINLGSAVILNFTSPIFVAMIAYIYLKENISRILWLLTVICFAGLYFLVGTQFAIKPFPILIGLFSGFWAAVAYSTIRLSHPQESSLTIIFYFTVIASVGSLPFLRLGFHMPIGAEWVPVAGVVVCSFFGQLFVTQAVREAPASVVSPFSYLTPVLSFAYGYLIWGDPITGRMLFGVLLIVVSGTFIYTTQRRPEPAMD